MAGRNEPVSPENSHRVVAVFSDPHEAEEAVEELRIAGVPPEQIEAESARGSGTGDAEHEPVSALTTLAVPATAGMARGWITGTLVGAVSGLVIASFLALAADLPWAATVLVGTVAGSVVGFVLGGAFGSLASDQGEYRAEHDTGRAATETAAATVDVSVRDRRMLRVARSILQRHHPVRVTVRH